MKFSRLSKTFLWGMIAVLLIGFLAGCSGRGSKSGSEEMATPSTGSSGEADFGDFEDEEEADPKEKADGDRGTEGNRKIIRNKYMQIETLEFDVFIEKLESLINQYAGYVDNSEVSGKGIYQQSIYNTRTANYRIRIPAQEFDTFIEEVKTFSTVLIERENKRDVTTQYFDLEARIRTLKVQEERLLELLESGARLEDILAIESQLSDVRYEIETYTATITNLDQEINYSTVQIEIREVYEISKTDEPAITISEKISKGFMNSLMGIRDALILFMIGFISGIPYLIIWGIIITGFVIALRKILFRKKRKGNSLNQTTDIEENKEDKN